MTLNRTAQTTAMMLAVTLYASAPLANSGHDEQRGHRHGPPPEEDETLVCAPESGPPRPPELGYGSDY